MTSRLLIEQLICRSLTEEEFRSLNVQSFQGPAHTDRTNKFVAYLKSKTPLSLVKSDESVVVDKVLILKKDDIVAAKEAGKKKKDYPQPTEYNPATQSKELKKILPLLSAGDRLILVDEKDNKYPITTVAKTIELGGKGKGGTLKPERAAIASLQSQFEEIGQPITITLGGITYSDITGVVNVKENQKADLALVNSENTPLIFISYKPGTSVKSIISYGGISTISEKSRDVKKFVDAIKQQVTDFEGLGYEFNAPLDDKNVILRSMYGSDFGSKSYGENNVQAIMQGTIKLVNKKGTYTIEADHIIEPPSIPDGEYTPVLNARYASDRNQMGLKHCRIGVVPQGARTNTKDPFIKQPEDNDQSNKSPRDTDTGK